MHPHQCHDDNNNKGEMVVCYIALTPQGHRQVWRQLEEAENGP